jgi:hypothetical protein
VGNLWEVKRRLIGWGSAASVIAPQELAKEIQKECNAYDVPNMMSPTCSLRAGAAL